MTPDFALLFNLAWKSSAVLTLAWVVAFGMRGHSAALRHMVWTSAFGALLLLPLWPTSMPALTVARENPIGELLATISASGSMRQLSSGGAVNSTSPPIAPAPPVMDYRVLLAWIWAAGTTLSLLRMFAAYIGIVNVRRAAKGFSGCEANRLAQSLGIRHGIEVLAIRAGRMPANFGSTVFLPVDAAKWEDQRRRAVMLHELAHVQRGDTAIHIVAGVAWSVYWWNPLASIAWRKLVDERERAVDDVVLQSGMEAADYAGHLTELARSIRPAGIAAPVLAAMARQSNLEVRVMAILDSKKNRRVPGRLMTFGVMAAALALLAPIAAVRAQARQEAEMPADLDAAMRNAMARGDAEALEKMASRAAGVASYENAEKLMKAALAIRARTVGERSADYGKWLLKMAHIEQCSATPSARQDYERALELLGNQPESADASMHLALFAMNDQNFIEAERMLERSIAVDPRAAAQPTMWLAVLREKQSRRDDAELLYRNALDLAAPGSETATVILELYANLLQFENRPEEAAALKAKALVNRKEQDRTAMRSSPAASSSAYKIGNGVIAPILLQKVEPQYSMEARLARYQGSTALAVDIGVDGAVQNPRVARGLGLGLSEKGLEAVRKWKFKPGTRNGEAVPVTANIEINFRLL